MKRFQKVVMILTMRCGHASLLMSDSLDRSLDLHERLALWGHLIACRSCPPLKRQLALIRAVARACYGKTQSVETLCCEPMIRPQLDPVAKERIKQAIREARPKRDS